MHSGNAEKDVDNIAVLIYSAPQVVNLSTHPDQDLIDVPDVAQPTFTSFETSPVAGPNFKLQRRMVS